MIRNFLLSLLCAATATASAQHLRDVLGGDVLMGVALNQWQTSGQDARTTAIVREHFNCLTPENVMKSGPLQPAEGVFDFQAADDVVAYAEANGLQVIGHCLVWHSQAPSWFFTDGTGKPVSAEVLRERIQKHISTVVGRYRGRIHGWDVVNEAIEDDGSFRRSPLYNILGEDFIELAFRAAHEADPDAELYYNDYSMALPRKREAVCRLVRRLKERGVRIDAVGMQSHLSLTHPDLHEYETTMDSLAATGVKVMVTELDVSVLPSPWGFNGAEVSQSFEYKKAMNPYTEGLPDSVQARFEERYLDLFRIYARHRQDLSRITFWGLTDEQSWLNGFPIKGRTDYPLLWNRDYRAKPVVGRIIESFR
ncbi:MAG: endo-1,4-beta-xylanase [Bacteroidaceae bacterium]|nr:endo-1,4-beta-xylanase [Bacteroidaceae bacterium]